LEFPQARAKFVAAGCKPCMQRAVDEIQRARLACARRIVGRYDLRRNGINIAGICLRKEGKRGESGVGDRGSGMRMRSSDCRPVRRNPRDAKRVAGPAEKMATRPRGILHPSPQCLGNTLSSITSDRAERKKYWLPAPHHRFCMARRTGPRFIGIAVGVHARASPHRLVNENNGRGRPGLFRESAPAATGARRVARAPYAGTTPLVAQDVVAVIESILRLPAHVNVNAIEVMPVQQAFAGFAIDRN